MFISRVSRHYYRIVMNCRIMKVPALLFILCLYGLFAPTASRTRHKRSATTDLMAFSYMVTEVKALTLSGIQGFEDLHQATKKGIQTTAWRTRDFEATRSMLQTKLESYGSRRRKLEDDLLQQAAPLVHFGLPSIDVSSLRGLWEASLGSNFKADQLKYLQSSDPSTRPADMISHVYSGLNKELKDVKDRLYFLEAILGDQLYTMRQALRSDPRLVGVASINGFDLFYFTEDQLYNMRKAFRPDPSLVGVASILGSGTSAQ